MPLSQPRTSAEEVFLHERTLIGYALIQISAHMPGSSGTRVKPVLVAGRLHRTADFLLALAKYLFSQRGHHRRGMPLLTCLTGRGPLPMLHCLCPSGMLAW